MSNKIDLQGRIAVVTGGAQGSVTPWRHVWPNQARAWLFGIATPQCWPKRSSRSAQPRKSFRSLSSSPMRRRSPAAASETEKALGRIDILVEQCRHFGADHAASSTIRSTIGAGSSTSISTASSTAARRSCRSMIAARLRPDRQRRLDRRQGGQPQRRRLLGREGRVIALTKSLGKELAGKNIAVNCVTPAAAKTRIFDQISQQHIDYMLSRSRAAASSRSTRPPR